MSRQKVYYTINEIIPNLLTDGKEWMLESFEEYTGLYHKYTTGEVFSEAKYNPEKSKKLIPFVEQTPTSKSNSIYVTLKPDLKTKYNTFQPYVPVLTAEDRKQGFITRYFIKKINSIVITEIDQSTFDEFDSKKIDPNLYKTIEVKWIISGPIQTITEGTVVRQGVELQNKNVVKEAKLDMPEITNKLNNFLELYIGDTNVATSALNTAPKDINNLDN